MRAQYIALMYPNGLPTNGVDSSVVGYSGRTLPTGCASITQYTIASPGQRSGGDPQHTYLMYPAGTPRNELVVFMCGHSGISVYCTADEGNTIPSLLAAGYHVLACDTAAFDWALGPIGSHVVVGGTWTYSAGSWHNSGGTLTHFTEHEFNFGADGGPLAMLQFVHHVIVSTTTAIATLSPGRVLLAGHSGGGVCGHVVAALDTRFSVFCSNCPALPYNQYRNYGNPADWEVYLVTEPYVNAPYMIDIWGALHLAASVQGRRTDVVSALNDEYWTIRDSALWHSDADTLSNLMAALGNTFTSWLDPAPFPQHNMHAARVTRMLQILAGTL